MKQLLNAGCGTHYAPGWTNCDIWADEHTRPDVVVNPGRPYPFEDGTFDAVFLGHVIEHIEWSMVPAFLSDMRRVAKPGAPVLVVGPDVFRTIQRWAKDQEPWDMVLSVMEHQDIPREDNPWDGATHHWNCHHDRVMALLETAGFAEITDYFERIPNNAHGTSWKDTETGITWPVVGKWFWQFAIHCRA